MTGELDRRSVLTGGGKAAAAAAVGAAAMLQATPAGAEPIIPLYIPVGPFRVYDTRDGDGKIVRNELVNLSGGAEPGDFAHCFNLTITGTQGASGYLSLFPGDIDWPGSSSINWFAANQTFANNALVTLAESDQSINVLCGGAPGCATHYILDLIAVIAFVDIGSEPQQMQAQAMARAPQLRRA